MADGHDWVVKKHSRAGKAHDFPDFLPHVRLIAVHFAVGAEGFRLHEGAAVAAAAGIGIQSGTVRAKQPRRPRHPGVCHDGEYLHQRSPQLPRGRDDGLYRQARQRQGYRKRPDGDRRLTENRPQGCKRALPGAGFVIYAGYKSLKAGAGYKTRPKFAMFSPAFRCESAAAWFSAALPFWPSRPRQPYAVPGRRTESS